MISLKKLKIKIDKNLKIKKYLEFFRKIENKILKYQWVNAGLKKINEKL